MNILGIGGLPSYASATLIRDGRIVAAVEQAKVARQRGPDPYPEAAIRECLRLGNVAPEEVHTVALSEMPLDLGHEFGKAQVVRVSHHEAHAASAYYVSPFQDATVLTLDRHGSYRNGELVLAETEPLAGQYSRVTSLLGFAAGADEHKVQWLSTAGTPGPAGRVQESITNAALGLAGDAANVCLAGGLAYNALLVRAFEQKYNVFVQPAAGNAGLSLGAALHVLGKHSDAGNYCLGPDFGPEEIKKVLENCKLSFRYLQTTDQIIGAALDWLAENKIVAWMQGRMEFGPRALGNRSILASPLDPYSSENLNTYIKHREAFRKFAASVPEERAAEYFECGPNARHLATVSRVLPEHKQRFQAALLGADLIRVHAVRKEDNPLYWRLLQEAGQRTGLPVLYNTSFNLFGEPLVCTPRDAVRSFYSSGIDAMLVGNFALTK